jgi:hypothetical protein
MAINTPTEHSGIGRPAMLALASALLIAGFAVGQATPNVVGAIGSGLDSAAGTEVTAPLARGVDYPPRRDSSFWTGILTRGDTYGLRHGAGLRHGPQAADTGAYVERAGGR